MCGAALVFRSYLEAIDLPGGSAQVADLMREAESELRGQIRQVLAEMHSTGPRAAPTALGGRDESGRPDASAATPGDGDAVVAAAGAATGTAGAGTTRRI